MVILIVAGVGPFTEYNYHYHLLAQFQFITWVAGFTKNWDRIMMRMAGSHGLVFVFHTDYALQIMLKFSIGHFINVLKKRYELLPDWHFDHLSHL